MGFIVDKLKLNAAARSMPQFCPAIRALLPEGAPEVTVEAATVFFYVRHAREVFGGRFATMLDRRLRAECKHARAGDFDACAARIRSETRAFEREMKAKRTSAHLEFEAYVRAIVTALMCEARTDRAELDLGRELHARFDAAMRRMKEHLAGIRSQNHFVLR